MGRVLLRFDTRLNTPTPARLHTILFQSWHWRFKRIQDFVRQDFVEVFRNLEFSAKHSKELPPLGARHGSNASNSNAFLVIMTTSPMATLRIRRENWAFA
jgi:hypothetical protein